MDLTRQDLKSIVATAITGFFVAAFLGVTNSLVAKKCLGELMVETKNLHRFDRVLLMQLFNFQTICGQKYPIDFGSFIACCDNLITIRLYLMRNKDLFEDLKSIQNNAWFMLNLCKHRSNSLKTRICEDLNEEDSAICEQVVVKIHHQLDEHYSAIVLLTTEA